METGKPPEAVKKKRVLFLANHFITLYAFRRELIRTLVEQGHEVILSLPEDPDNGYFSRAGCEIVPTPIDRRGVNPIRDLKLIFFYRKLLSRVRPDIVFSYTIKPNIYGTLASNALGYRQVCNITGTGATFLTDSGQAPLKRAARFAVRELVKVLYRHSVRNCYQVFFQNRGDRDFFLSNRMVRDGHYARLPGSGCDLTEHPFSPMPGEPVSFLFSGRIMAVKGVDEYLSAARLVRERHPETRFYLAGWIEEEPFREKVEAAQREGNVIYLGFRKDIQDWIQRTHCTVLASHGGEGVSNALLESAATGRACIASDIPGCADAVEDGVTGYLFPAGKAEALAEKMERFLSLSPAERAAMGQAGRKKTEQEFDRRIVIEAYLEEVEKA